jgi:predicted transcriptional regulator YdeE
MKVRHIEKLMVAGLGVRTNNNNEMNPETAKIGQLWDDYQDKNILGKTFNKANKSSMYGVYSDYESDVNGDYTVTVAVEVTKPKNAIIIKDQRYLVFSKEGELPEIVIECWKDVWEYFEKDSEYERAYTIDFENYSIKSIIVLKI